MSNLDRRIRTLKRRVYLLTLILFLFNVLCNSVVAFAAFGYVPGTKEWKWERAMDTMGNLIGGFWGALITAVVLIAVTVVIVIAVNGGHNRTIKAKLGLGISLAIIIVLSAVFAEKLSFGSAVFFVAFAVIFTVETFVEHWISNKLREAKAAKATALATPTS